MKKKTIYFLMYDQCIVHGGFFDNFEYYYIIKKAFPDCDVKWRCVTDHSREDVLALLQDKYDGIELKVWKDIEVLPHIFGKFYRDPIMIDVLICATNSAIYWFVEHGSFQAAKTFIGLADWRDIHPKHHKIYKNSITLCDERIFDYEGKTEWRSYRKKVLFDKFREKEYGAKYDYLLNLSLVERRFSQEFLMGLFEEYGGTFACYSGMKNEKFYQWMNDIPNVDLVIPPVDDFMGLFQNYIYLPYKDGWDATPRLFPECVFYNKGIEYYDKGPKMKSGGYYRYNDTLDNYDGLWLKEDDEIVNIVGEYI